MMKSYYSRTTRLKKRTPSRSRSIANQSSQDLFQSAISPNVLQSNSLIQKKDEEKTNSKDEDLKSKRFSGISELELAFDDKFLLFNGQSGEFVRTIQEALEDFGFELKEHGTDGIFGPETEAAVRDFQNMAGATMIDGLIGPETMGLLDNWAVEKEKNTKGEKKKVIKKIKGILKEKEKEIEKLPENIFKIENNRIAQEVVALYLRHKKGERIKDNFMSHDQVRRFFYWDKGDPKKGTNPRFLWNVDKAATNYAFDILEKQMIKNTDIDSRIEDFLYKVEWISREMNEGFEEFRSKEGVINDRTEKKDYEALFEYFSRRTNNKLDIYYVVTHS